MRAVRQMAQKWLVLSSLLRNNGRMADNRWAKKCTEWTPYERKRSRGRPRKRWRDEIVEKAGVNWMRRTGKKTKLENIREAAGLQWPEWLLMMMMMMMMMIMMRNGS